MDAQLKKGLLEICVLTAIREKESYGYKIISDLAPYVEISESTLYPVLRRLQKDNCLEAYDKAIDGRNRRYYKLTEAGRLQLAMYKGEWAVYSGKITRILEEAKL